jgi:ribosome-binding ATPase YchF (GTP1/OBG family)
VRHSDLLAAGSMAAAREIGRLRSEGRDYVVQDGDVIHFHFSA